RAGPITYLVNCRLIASQAAALSGSNAAAAAINRQCGTDTLVGACEVRDAGENTEANLARVRVRSRAEAKPARGRVRSRAEAKPARGRVRSRAEAKPARGRVRSRAEAKLARGPCGRARRRSLHADACGRARRRSLHADACGRARRRSLHAYARGGARDNPAPRSARGYGARRRSWPRRRPLQNRRVSLCQKHRQECLCHTAAERLQKIARGESEANTPRKTRAPRSCAASAALEKSDTSSSAADAAQILLELPTRGVRFAPTPRYLLSAA